MDKLIREASKNGCAMCGRKAKVIVQWEPSHPALKEVTGNKTLLFGVCTICFSKGPNWDLIERNALADFGLPAEIH